MKNLKDTDVGKEKSMYRILKISIFILIAIVITVSGFAQTDSTNLTDSSINKIVAPIVSATTSKYVWATGVLAFLFAVSEALSLIPSVKSNGVFELIFRWLGIIKDDTKNA